MPTVRDRILKIQDRRMPTAAARPATSLPVKAGRVIARNGTFGVEHLALNQPTFNNKVSLHVSADESRKAILDAIRTAKEAFWIEMFIWHDDTSGRQVAQALIDRKRMAESRGEPFDARVLVDWSGLRDASSPSKGGRLMDLMRENGIEVLEFNRGGVDPTAAGVSPITHRKLFIQDGKKFLSGGRNIGDEYLQPKFTNPKNQQEYAWHDLMFTIEGDETARVQREFLKNWVMAGGQRPKEMPALQPAVGGSAWVQSVVTDPHAKTTELRDTHLKLIRYAEQEIRLVYPYFSDDTLIEELIAAKKRNPKLKIKLLVPGQGERGIPGFLFGNLNLESARQLIAAGIEVRMLNQREDGEQRVEAFSHFKALAVDGKVLSLGSANGDARTLAHNHELNAVIRDPQLARHFIDRVIGPDWEHATPVTAQTMAALPWWRRVVMGLLEALDFMF